MIRPKPIFHAPDTGDNAASSASHTTAAAPTPTSTVFTETGSAWTPSTTEPRSFITNDGTFQQNWTDHLPEEMGDARNSLRRFKNVGDLAKSYRELESKIGAKGVIIPTEKSSPEEIAAYRQQLGIPETPDGYDIKPAELPEGLAWDDNAVKPALEIAHKHNIPPAAMQELVAWNMERELARGTVMQQMAVEELKTATSYLQNTWKSEFEPNLTRAAQAAKMVGIDPRSPGFTDPEVVRGFYELSKLLSEDKFVNGGRPENAGDRSQATDIMTNKANPLYQKYQDADPETVSRVRQLLAG